MEIEHPPPVQLSVLLGNILRDAQDPAKPLSLPLIQHAHDLLEKGGADVIPAHEALGIGREMWNCTVRRLSRAQERIPATAACLGCLIKFTVF